MFIYIHIYEYFVNLKINYFEWPRSRENNIVVLFIFFLEINEDIMGLFCVWEREKQQWGKTTCFPHSVYMSWSWTSLTCEFAVKSSSCGLLRTNADLQYKLVMIEGVAR